MLSNPHETLSFQMQNNNSTKSSEVTLSAFIYRLFHEDFPQSSEHIVAYSQPSTYTSTYIQLFGGLPVRRHRLTTWPPETTFLKEKYCHFRRSVRWFQMRLMDCRFLDSGTVLTASFFLEHVINPSQVEGCQIMQILAYMRYNDNSYQI